MSVTITPIIPFASWTGTPYVVIDGYTLHCGVCDQTWRATPSPGGKYTDGGLDRQAVYHMNHCEGDDGT